MAEPLVRFEGVQKSYSARTAPAVRALDLVVERGELLTLLGPSGSGKTTTLMMLAGFEHPTAGRILLKGRDIAGLAPHKRGIGVVFQSYALFPHMDVAANIGFPLEVRGMSRGERDRRIRAALEMVRLDGMADRRPAQLSGGQQQRVALARALVFEPPIVLLDEPLGALDRNLREEMQFEIRRIHHDLGVTMLYVTHDQAEALTLSDRIAVFEHGEIRQLAAPQAMYDSPANAFVAGFVGENNLLPGTVLERDGDECLIALQGGLTAPAMAVDAGGPGSACLLAIRPERIAVAAMRADELGAGALPAQLREAIFQGDHVRLRLAIGDGVDILARRPAGLGALPVPGGPAAIAWDASHARAFRPPDTRE